MTNRCLLSIVSFSLLASTVFAGTMGSSAPPKDWAFVGSLSAGPIWTNDGETQTFYLTPTIEKTYVSSESTHTRAAGELFLGMQTSLNTEWLGQWGLAVATGSAKLQGVIWDDANAQFNNHRYQYAVRNTRLAVKGKVLLDKGYCVMPWLSASLGVGFNRAYEFTNTPLIFEALPNNNFTDHTNTAFTYNLGAGVQKTLNDHWQAGVGYEFADWGKSALARAAGQSLNTGLVLDHLYTNGLLFNLTYVA